MRLSKAEKQDAIKKYKQTIFYSTQPNKVFYVNFKDKATIYVETGDIPDNKRFSESSMFKVWVNNFKRSF